MIPENNHRPGKSGKWWQPAVLLTLVALGILLQITGLIDWHKVLQWAQEYSGHWWLALLLILLQATLFTLALPGSAILWVVAPLYNPITATVILVSGSTLGALGAYTFSHKETLRWSGRVHDSHLFHVLKTRSDFLSLTAIRLIPAFPHSVINYGAGILELPLDRFIVSTMIGLSAKTFLYCYTIDTAISVNSLADLMQIKIVAPLLILAILAALAALLRKHWTHR